MKQMKIQVIMKILEDNHLLEDIEKISQISKETVQEFVCMLEMKNDKSIHMNKQSYTKQIADAIQRSFSELDEDTYSYLSKNIKMEESDEKYF